MPTKTPAADNGSFDDLLDTPPSSTEKEAIVVLQDAGDPVETPEQARIRELEAKLASIELAAAEAAEAAALEATVKTPEEKNREHAEAVNANRRALAAPERFEEEDGDDEEFIVFHVVHSGLTFAGRVWHVGQNVRVKRGGKAYLSTLDRNGVSWLDDLSTQAQFARYRKIVVGEGPWVGPEFNDEISAADAKRDGALPVITL